MTALTTARNTPARLPGNWYGPVEAAAKGYAGGVCAYNAAGNIVSAAAALGLVAAGRIEESFNNAASGGWVPPGGGQTGVALGAAGAFYVTFQPGVFGLNNSGAGVDLVTRAMIGQQVWMVDDNTVAATNGGGGGAATRSLMGTLVDLDANGVCWVHVGLIPTAF